MQRVEYESIPRHLWRVFPRRIHPPGPPRIPASRQSWFESDILYNWKVESFQQRFIQDFHLFGLGRINEVRQ